MVNRRLLLASGIVAIASPLAVLAQGAPRKVYRIGFIVSETAASQRDRINALRAGLRDLGYFEGRNLAIDTRTADGRYERLPQLAKGLVAEKVDVIVAFGIKALEAAHAATTTIPIVIPATSSDLVALGLIASPARPGGNVTGSTTFGPQIMAERLELVREVSPGTKRVAILVNPANAGVESTMKHMEAVAGRLRLDLSTYPVREPNEFEQAFARMVKARVEAIVVQDDTLFGEENANAIARLASRQRMPSVGGIGFANQGGTFGLGRSDDDLYRRGANFVDRILRGEAPSEIPIEQASRFELVINRNALRLVGIKLPPSILLRADRVIE